MHAELTYRMEMARVLEARIREAETVQECAGSDLAFHRALKFWHEQIIGGLQLSVEELAPIRAEVLPNGGGELAEFIRALEYGEVPAPQISNGAGSIESMCLSTGKESSVKVRARAPISKTKGRSLFEKRARDPIAAGKSSTDATRDSVPLVPSDEKSREVMAQWR